MAVAVQPHIRCPRCGGTRVVTPRQARRVRQGVHDGRCTTCRGVPSSQRVRDDDLRFWLARFGSPCPPETPVRQFIVAGGAPPELIELAREVWGRPKM